MNLADCYRLLGLRSGASFQEIKASYRRLARQYHPDANPEDQQSKDKFIAVTEAYRYLMEVVKPTEEETLSASGASAPPSNPQESQPSPTAEIKVKVTRKPPPIQINPELSPLEQELKRTSYEQLQQHLKYQRFPRAIALVEGLAQRIPKDPEIRQWQAITYQRWGRHLIREKQLDKARIYLKKALRTDPHNRSLWSEVEKDFRRIEERF
ncbi:MAG: J domain-containing protein [Leptolyngbyaceae bacterium]|nr:J domain-containing protein [Leptolyngbyaceae bacterium]